MTKLDEIIEMGWNEEYDGWTVEDCIHMVTGDTQHGYRKLAQAILNAERELNFAENKGVVSELGEWMKYNGSAGGYALVLCDNLIRDYLVNVCPQPSVETRSKWQ